MQSMTPTTQPTTAERIPIERALKACDYIRDQLAIPRCLVAGSIRRRVPMVKDIELVVPMPLEGAPDVLYDRIAVLFSPRPDPDAALNLFTRAEPPAGKWIGRVVKGHNERFRYCQLALRTGLEPQVDLNIDIFRYDPGEKGNRGWIELIRTGPDTFGRGACIRWKTLSNGRSDEGYPRHSDGTAVAVPSEEAAFQLLKWPWVEPWDRR